MFLIKRIKTFLKKIDRGNCNIECIIAPKAKKEGRQEIRKANSSRDGVNF